MKLPHFQFRLRTLLIGVTLLAVPMGYIGWQTTIVKEREEFLSKRPHSDPDFFDHDKPHIPWILRLMGAKPVYWIVVDSASDAERAAALFPEAFIDIPDSKAVSNR
jgi:hypothetical protein